MAISVADNFQYLGTKPLDARLKFASVSDMVSTAAASLYDGCFAYVTATKKYYSYDSTNTVDVTLGKWREYSSGGDTIQVSSMPTASASELGKVYQYIGSTTLVYTHGYFYECVSDGEATPTYSWSSVDVQDKADLTNYVQKSQTAGLLKNDGTVDTTTAASSIKWDDVKGDVQKNLVFKVLSDVIVNSSGVITTDSQFDCMVAKVKNGQSYCVLSNELPTLVYAFFSSEPEEGSTSYNSSRTVDSSATTSTQIEAPIDGYLVVRVLADYSTPMIRHASVSDTTYAPYVPSNSELNNSKQDTLTAGNGINIVNNTISTDNMPSTDMSEIITPLPTNIPSRGLVYDERGTEYIIGKYINSQGVEKPLYQSVRDNQINTEGEQITGGTQFASSSLNTTYKISYAFDNNPSTSWLPSITSSPSYVGLQNISESTFGKATVSISVKGSDSSNWVIQGSNDGETWIDISESITPSSATSYTLNSITNNKYTNIRLYTSSGLCPSDSTGRYTAISEIKFYAKNDYDIIIKNDKFFNANKYLCQYTKTTD